MALISKYKNNKGTFWRFTIEKGKDEITGKRKRISNSGFKTKKEAKLAAYKQKMKGD